MKNRYIILFLSAVLAFSATSCNDFLDTVPDNRTELDTDEKIRKILVSAYPDRTYALYTNFMSDDHDDIGTRYGDMSSFDEHFAQAWNWEPVDNEDEDDTPGYSWQAYYLAITNANQALDAIEKAGDPERLSALKGEALICRAYAHFVLVNLFCQNYSELYSGSDAGVPYVDFLETSVDQKYDRGTVKGVYEKIERDILDGLPLIDDNIYEVPQYHFNRLAANAFAAEFYLFYKKYDEAIKYANVVLGDNPGALMRDVTSWAGTQIMPADIDVRGLEYINPNVSANLLLQTAYSTVGLASCNYFYNKRFLYNDVICQTETLASPSVLWNESSDYSTFLTECYEFTSTPSMPTRMTVSMFFEMTDPVAQIGFYHSVLPIYTTENSLLVRAEAHIMNEDYGLAMNDINLWVGKHVNPSVADASPKTELQVEKYYESLPYYTYNEPTAKKKMSPEVPFTGAKQENFMHALLHIRRIEFAEEGRRWFDVKRYNIEIHRRQYRLTNQGVDFQSEDVLIPRDPRMAIQLPTSVILAGLGENPGY